MINESPLGVAYRYDQVLYSSGVDDFDGSLGPPRVDVLLREYRILSKTPKGIWIDFEGKKFINQSATKQFALPTKELAKASFIARKICQLTIMRNQMKHIEDSLYIARYGKLKDILES